MAKAQKRPEHPLPVDDMPLHEWLRLLEDPPKGVIFRNWQFPTSQHRHEYLASIAERSEREVIDLVRRFLLLSQSIGADERILDWVLDVGRQDAAQFEKLENTEYVRRLIRSLNPENPPPWEGITWILDLLPHSPRRALDALNAYAIAHARWLPDGRLTGLGDASTLIRAKFIGDPDGNLGKVGYLHTLSSRDFECVVERLYAAMGYATALTPARSDGGRDILARHTSPGRKDEFRIECKKYANRAGVEHPRRLLGVVSSEKAARGVLVALGGFTRGARQFASDNVRIELLSGTQLVVLMNEHLGADWTCRLALVVAESIRSNEEPAPDILSAPGDALPAASRSVRRR